MIAFRKWIILTHRYLGIVLLLLFVMWFVSAIAMIYARGMPSLTSEMRLERLLALDMNAVKLTASQAAEKAELGQPPGGAVLLMIMGRPAYRFISNGTATVFADTGELLPDIRQAESMKIAGSFVDELAVASVVLTRTWRVAAFVGAGVEEVLAPLGNLREGLLGPVQWIATAALEPDEGPDSGWFVAKYRHSVGVDPPYPAAQAFAAGLLCARCLRDSGVTEDAAQLAAARQLNCTTLYGRFRIDPVSGLQVGHQVLIVQWQNSIRRVVWPPEQAERPLL